MQALIHPLTELADYEEIEKKKQKEPGTIRILGCVNSPKTHMMYGFAGEIRSKVIICPSESRARQVYEEYRFLDGSTYLYPAKDLLFYQADLRSRELVSRRMEVLEAVIEGGRIWGTSGQSRSTAPDSLPSEAASWMYFH